MEVAAAVAANWETASRSRRRQTVLASAGLAALILLSGWMSRVDPGGLLDGLPRIAGYIARTLPPLHATSLRTDLGEWMWDLPRWLELLLDTALIAYVGTVLGAAAALLLSFLAAANASPHPALAFAARRLMDLARTVPVLVFALIFVFAFGLGPLPGALAVAVHSTGSLGKLFSEMHENALPGPTEGVRATGATWSAAMRLGLLPQSLPGIISYCLLRLEVNMREASILGFVGAGGIGQELYLVVRRFEYTDISALVLLIVLAVTLLDTFCLWARHRLVGTLRAK